MDELVEWDPTWCRLSPGRRIEALVLNILAGRSPLYRVAEFYEDTAAGLIFGPGGAAEHLTDDCLARALDKLAESGPRAVPSYPPQYLEDPHRHRVVRFGSSSSWRRASASFRRESCGQRCSAASSFVDRQPPKLDGHDGSDGNPARQRVVLGLCRLCDLP